jgi:hypothetical protein
LKKRELKKRENLKSLSVRFRSVLIDLLGKSGKLKENLKIFEGSLKKSGMRLKLNPLLLKDLFLL